MPTFAKASDPKVYLKHAQSEPQLLIDVSTNYSLLPPWSPRETCQTEPNTEGSFRTNVLTAAAERSHLADGDWQARQPITAFQPDSHVPVSQGCFDYLTEEVTANGAYALIL